MQRSLVSLALLALAACLGACRTDVPFVSCSRPSDCHASDECRQGVCVAVSAVSTDSGELACPAGLVKCGGRCVDPQADRAFCGATGDCAAAHAGEACAAGEVCSAGTCSLSCQAGLVDCGGRCVDPQADRAFCGATGDCAAANSGRACAAGEVCSAGTCSLSCQAGLVDCGGKCVDPKADRVFCGAKEDCAAANAGKTCVAGEVCSAGTCTLSCQAELLNCGGKCVDPKADRVFCGARLDCAAANAGKPCAAGEVCSAGICTLTSGHPDASTSTGSRDGSFSADAASSAPDAGVTRDAATAGPDASSSFAFDAGQSGVLCIHAGEMRSPPSSTYGAGQLYVSICPGLTCALSNFAQCTRTLLCSYTPPSCGRCIAGFADGTYTVAAFVDINGDAVSSAPIPSTGDAVPADCGGVTISGGVQAPNPLNIIIQNFAP